MKKTRNFLTPSERNSNGMKKVFNFLRSKIIDIKIYIARTTSWIGMANSLMLVFLVIERLSNMGVIKGDLGNSLIFVVILWFLLLVFMGWLEIKKIKAPHVEAEKMLKLNPPFEFMYNKIGEIDERTKEMEKKLNDFEKRLKC